MVCIERGVEPDGFTVYECRGCSLDRIYEFLTSRGFARVSRNAPFKVVVEDGTVKTLVLYKSGFSSILVPAVDISFEKGGGCVARVKQEDTPVDAPPPALIKRLVRLARATEDAVAELSRMMPSTVLEIEALTRDKRLEKLEFSGMDRSLFIRVEGGDSLVILSVDAGSTKNVTIELVGTSSVERLEKIINDVFDGVLRPAAKSIGKIRKLAPFVVLSGRRVPCMRICVSRAYEFEPTCVSRTDKSCKWLVIYESSYDGRGNTSDLLKVMINDVELVGAEQALREAVKRLVSTLSDAQRIYTSMLVLV